MDNALIISGGQKSISSLMGMLNQAFISNVAAVNTAGDARTLLMKSDYDLCVINTPLPDESGVKLAQDVAAKGRSEIILIVKADSFDEVSQKTTDYGIVAVEKPLNKALFWSAIKLTQAAHKRFQNIQIENDRLHRQIEDIRVVNRAKCVLISYLAMTEPEAHKYIEKHAMDMRLTRRAVADEILKTYEM